VSCTAGFQPTPSPAPTSTPTPRATTIDGPSCPEGFQENQAITDEVAVDASSHMTLTLGFTPSIPCGWQTLEIADVTVLHQLDQTSEWPAEEVTPMPGAPGTEIWVLEPLEQGQTAVTLNCVCLGEEGEDEVLRGRFVLDVTVE